MRVKRIGYVGLRTDDVDAMTSFFRDVIGLEAAGEGEMVFVVVAVLAVLQAPRRVSRTTSVRGRHEALAQ